MLSHAFVPDSLQPHGLQPARLLCPWNSLGQEYWSRLPFPPPGDVPNPGIKPRSPALQADSLSSGKPREAQEYWSGWPIPSPGDLLYPGIKPGSYNVLKLIKTFCNMC